jgi:hypothetical protein
MGCLFPEITKFILLPFHEKVPKPKFAENPTHFLNTGLYFHTLLWVLGTVQTPYKCLALVGCRDSPYNQHVCRKGPYYNKSMPLLVLGTGPTPYDKMILNEMSSKISLYFGAFSLF